MHKSLLAAFLLASLAAPSISRADHWNDCPWLWGGAGVIAGGTLGYIIGRDHGSNYYPSYGYAPAPYYAPPAYAPAESSSGPAPSASTYYREKWAFPFYHKIESCPIAPSGPLVNQPAAVSMASGNYAEPVRNVQHAATDQLPANHDVTINVGDNNSNLTFNVGGKPTGADGNPAIQQIRNNPDTVGDRVVDVTTGQYVQTNNTMQLAPTADSDEPTSAPPPIPAEETK